MIAVLGAGAAGLSAGLELKDRGVEVLVLEAAPRAGGKLGTIRESGYLLERAAVGLLDRQGDLAPLARRLGLTLLPASPTARKRWLYRHKKLRSPLGALSFGELVSLLREPWRAPGDPEGESVSAFFARRLGKGGAFLGDVLQTGIYAGDPALLELAAAFPQLAELERTHGGLVRGLLKTKKREGPPPRLTSFAGGLEELTSALARELGPALRLGVRVRAVAAEGKRFRLSLLDPAGISELVADALVVALPAPDAAELLAPLDAALGDGLRALRAAPLAVVSVGVRREDLRHAIDGFGLLAPGEAVAGTLLPSSIFAGRAPEGRVLLTSLVGGARNPEAAALPDGELLALVRGELEKTLRLRPGAAPDLEHIVRWPQAIPQYDLGHLARIAGLTARAAALPGRLSLTGSWYRGVSVLDCLRDGRAQARAIAS